MANLILLNKPFHVLSQFTDSENRSTLKDYVTQSGFYPAGRLDYDSEGLLILTDDGQTQHQLANPAFKLEKTYWVQVEGVITDKALQQLVRGVQLKDGKTKPAKAKAITQPQIWNRTPPIRQRKDQPTSWLELKIKEGKNRQVRRMTAAVGFPTLRLIRYAIGNWTVDNLAPGENRCEAVHLAIEKKKPSAQKNNHGRSTDRRVAKSTNHRTRQSSQRNKT
ncbi:MAG: RsuA protein [Osedax symbiont Rs2]|nr:MAG: RsuA protein [Osedax symbiont Rs2]